MQAMFLSNYRNSLDAKGRLSIPATFRAALQGQQKIVMWPSFESPCLEGGGRALLASYRSVLQTMSAHDPTRRAIMHAVFGRAREYALDSTGRIVLDREHAAFASLDDNALLVGLDDRFQIWNPDAYCQIEAQYVQTAHENSIRLAPCDNTASR